MSVVREVRKIRLCQTIIFAKKNHEGAKFTNKKHEKSTLRSLKAKHLLEMSIKLKLQCERFEKNHCFALMVLNWFPICFYQGLFRRYDLYHTIVFSIIPKLKK